MVTHIKNTFTNIINKNMELIDFENLDVEDRLLSCLRAEQSGDKLRRVIDLRRQNALETVYTRWTAKEATQKLIDNKKETQEKINELK
jgi:hypothetical protein